MKKFEENFGKKIMKKMMGLMMSVLILSVLGTDFVFAAHSDMKEHDMEKSNKIGDLIHESAVNGYMLSYYFMDLRHQKTDGHDMAAPDKSHDMASKEMDKPHHLMVYIMDINNKAVLKGKVGFMIKNAEGKNQKAMGMFMSEGFGTTANMKEKGIYTITTKAILDDKKLMDKFEYEIK